jgi:hypothetical protein
MLAISKMMGMKTAVRFEIAALNKPATKLGGFGQPRRLTCRAQAGKKQQASPPKIYNPKFHFVDHRSSS